MCEVAIVAAFDVSELCEKAQLQGFGLPSRREKRFLSPLSHSLSRSLSLSLSLSHCLPRHCAWSFVWNVSLAVSGSC